MKQQQVKQQSVAVLTRIRKLLLGMGENDGIVFKLVVYLLLIGIGFIYLYPLLFMLVNSFMSLDDLVNSMVKWIPTSLYTENYEKALQVLNFRKTLMQTILVAGVPSIIQMVMTSVIGYGFARFDFPLKKLWFALMIATFIIPPSVTMIPTYLMFKDYHLLGTLKTYIYPAFLGQGLKSALFIMIFYQFFKKLPVVLEEAAQIDGAGYLKMFYRIAVPTAGPAFIIVFLFSFVWYWNESYLAALYFGNKLTILPLELQKFTDSFTKMFPQSGGQGNQINEAIKMAGTMLTIAPLLVVYFVLQRWFVEGVDRSGITGE
ncbi:carbohydrate ABC transporter membrane protein 2 (CUT1 family) [Paenibacillus taihuensis]|uniref:Carbohydrate ABC transporter membrane protein 2 (CUT1 family) n=1 Tax=Paenibacillus taihuensis TaxID=1156355 RepID=A0A3D9RZ49_9BACL|nr:carbohydrate ABC transporter permease [Paenibacillus taihuensis]REE85344.1 carbohydrate ABC transporter membrane protein 2 (CUT1 family) [Paenibacillus taihuensis]